jgi:hypothetical protein
MTNERKQTAKKTKTKPNAKNTKKATAKSKPAKESKAKKLSAIDAAAQVLSKSNKPLNCKELIETMSAQKLWTSPGGKTPSATLYSALLREITTKGKDSRFKKVERGQFAISK